MPFGPHNGPPTYTAMMCKLTDEWNGLFYSCHHGPLPMHSSNSIIDNILMWSMDPMILLSYFKCICKIFVKYCVSFRLDKCEFFLDHLEYVGHDLTPNGNCPATSKFNLLQDWPLPTNGLNLHSFLGLCSFYNRYCPWFETKATPLQAIISPTNIAPFLQLNGWIPRKLSFTALSRASPPHLALPVTMPTAHAS